MGFDSVSSKWKRIVIACCLVLLTTSLLFIVYDTGSVIVLFSRTDTSAAILSILNIAFHSLMVIVASIGLIGIFVRNPMILKMHWVGLIILAIIHPIIQIVLAILFFILHAYISGSIALAQIIIFSLLYLAMVIITRRTLIYLDYEMSDLKVLYSGPGSTGTGDDDDGNFKYQTEDIREAAREIRRSMFKKDNDTDNRYEQRKDVEEEDGDNDNDDNDNDDNNDGKNDKQEAKRIVILAPSQMSESVIEKNDTVRRQMASRLSTHIMKRGSDNSEET